MVYPSAPTLDVLTPSHDVSSFTSGKPEIDNFLKRGNALAGMTLGFSVTKVVVSDDNKVIAYLTYGLGSVSREEAAPRLAQYVPAYPQPVLVLQRLGIDTSVQGSGLGRMLVREVLQHALLMAHRAEVSGEPPIRAVMVQALDDEAKAYYQHLGITEVSLLDPNLLFLPIKDLKKLGL